LGTVAKSHNSGFSSEDMDIASWSVSSEQASGVFSLETASSFYINDGYSNETNSGDSFPDIHIPPNQFANTSLEISPIEDKTLRPSSPSYNNYCWISSLHQIDPTLVPPTFHMDVNANCNSNHDYLSVANSVNSFELLLNVRYTDEDASRLGFMPSQEDIDGCNTQYVFHFFEHRYASDRTAEKVLRVIRGRVRHFNQKLLGKRSIIALERIAGGSNPLPEKQILNAMS
jgi:hypothetical protein